MCEWDNPSMRRMRSGQDAADALVLLRRAEAAVPMPDWARTPGLVKAGIDWGGRSESVKFYAKVVNHRGVPGLEIGLKGTF